MLFWQLALLFTLFITTNSILWPTSMDNDKMCIHLTGPYGGDAKCGIYCQMRGKSGGSCQKKRCVCTNDKGRDDDSNEHKSLKLPSFPVKQKSIVTCNVASMKCRRDCTSMGQLKGSCINGVCVCSKF
jgi:hypothetical protein